MAKRRSSPQSRIADLLLCSIFLLFPSGIFSSRYVTLDSIQIFQSHEWFGAHPTVYFLCRGENMTFLPDVKETFLLYNFKGEESWQPLTELPDKKCKRCGLYEQDRIKADDVFDEWELCPDDFMAPNGTYVHFKAKEFNATFLCQGCIPLVPRSTQTPDSENGDHDKKRSLVSVILIGVLVSLLSIIGAVAAYTYWQRKKREQDQARFLKLFDEVDDVEDELGLAHAI